MSSARAEAANAVVQRYAGQERAPLLILNALWQGYRDNPAPAGFYASRRDALFHDGMNTPPGQRRQGIDQIIGQAPYRNGGLFERNAPDQQGIVIGDHIIEGTAGV